MQCLHFVYCIIPEDLIAAKDLVEVGECRGIFDRVRVGVRCRFWLRLRSRVSVRAGVQGTVNVSVLHGASVRDRVPLRGRSHCMTAWETRLVSETGLG